MLVSRKGLAWNKGYLVPFTLYFDDSGTDSQAPVANATGLIVPAKRILALEKEWAALKEEENFGDFHTAEFVFRNKKSEFANWKDDKHRRVFLRVREMVKKYGAQVFSFSVKKADYDSCVPPEIRKHSGQSHYVWAVRQVSMLAQIWRVDKGVTEPFEWIFDWLEKKDPVRKEIEDLFDQLEFLNESERGMKHEFTNYDFRPGKTLGGLRLADLLAWTNFNFALQQWGEKPLNLFPKIAWDDFASMPSRTCPMVASLFRDADEPIEWNCAVGLTRKQLSDLLSRELAGGRSLSLIQKWEEEKNKRALSRRFLL